MSGGDSNNPGVIAAICALAFVVLASYGFARPATESLFIEYHGSESLPWVWLLVALVATGSVTLYNQVAARVALRGLFLGVISATGLLLIAIQGLLHLEIPGAYYALYVWKDLYIVFLVEMIWTFANHIYSERKATGTYGLFLLMGSFGGMAGNASGGALATTIGSRQNLWMVLPLLAIAALLFVYLNRSVEPPKTQEKIKDETSWGTGVRAIAGSSLLVLMLLLIVLSQITITLIDFQYNVALESTFPDEDVRTAMGSQIYFFIDCGAIALQLLTGPILHSLGVGRTLMMIPLLLGGAVTIFAFSPRFATIAFAKITSKCFDYSIFRAAKEILYIPLSRAEKTQGKAIIDILTYRVAKGATSLMLIVLKGLTWSGALLFANITLGFIAVWVAAALGIAKRHQSDSEGRDG
jgi:ATP:ADP antiporter, AAA family